MTKLPEMTAYSNQAMGITLAVPVSWTGKVLAPLAFRIFSPPQPKYNNYRATLSVEKIDLKEAADEKRAEFGKEALEELIAQAQADLKSEMHNFQSQREERYTSSDGLPAYSNWFHWLDPETGTTYSQIQALLLTSQGDLFIFNAAALKPLESGYLPVFNHMILSAHI
jgi:hypothetical protein